MFFGVEYNQSGNPWHFQNIQAMETGRIFFNKIWHCYFKKNLWLEEGGLRTAPLAFDNILVEKISKVTIF